MINCIICNNPIFRTLYHMPDIRVVKCINCGLVCRSEFLLPSVSYEKEYFMSKNPLEVGYADYIADKSILLHTFRKRFGEIIKHKERGSILDIGCAMGFFLSVASEYGWEAVGIESSEFAISYLKNNFSFKVYPSFKKTGFPQKYFDVITMWDYIEHISDPLLQLEECHNVLKDNGIIFITAPDIDSFASVVFKEKWIGIKPEHLFYFSLETIKKLLEKTGFRIISSKHTGKYMRIGMLLDRIKHYSSFIGSAFNRLLPAKIKESAFYVNGFDILQIAAEKR